MRKTGRIFVAVAIASAAFIGSETQASAWGCFAQADDGTYGYSYNFNNKRGAKRRAEAECEARTYEDCYIVSCDPNG